MLSIRIPLVLVALTTAVSAQQFQFQLNQASGHWYGTSHFPITNWSSGRSAAIEVRGELVSITSAGEQAWIQGAFGTGVRYWTGLNDIASPTNFVWTTGEPVSYQNWQPGQPSNAAGEDVVELDPGAGWVWKDMVGTASDHKPIVETDGLPRFGWKKLATSVTGDQPGALFLGDLNADPRADAAVPAQNAASVSLWTGQADGTFAFAGSFATGARPVAVQGTDVDLDGDTDLIVACHDASQIRIHLNQGGASFSGGATLSLGAKPQGLVVVDLNGDNRADIAVTTVLDGNDRLRLLFGDGAGGFSAPVSYGTGSHPHHVTAADLDGDTDVDLVVSNRNSADLGIYRNLGDGNFVTGALYARGATPGRVAIGDVTGDGHVDVLVPLETTNLLQVLDGTPSGNFVPGVLYDTDSSPRWASLVDHNRDGYLDAVVACASADSITLYTNTAGNFFGAIDPLTGGDGPRMVEAADVDGDGWSDLVVSAFDQDHLGVLVKLSRDCNANGRDDDRDIALGGSVDCNTNGDPDECDLALGATFDCDANGAVDSCEIAQDPQLDLDNDEVLDECESAGFPYCFGDSTGSACPCDPGQAGNSGSGCRNSVGESGRLIAVGNPSVAHDSVSLRATGLLPFATGLFFQGTVPQNAGLGTMFGDGLLCANGVLVRMEIRDASGGAMAFGRDVPTDPAISVDGNVPTVGATRYYQVWYRDAANFCTTLTYNLTNGVRVVWSP